MLDASSVDGWKSIASLRFPLQQARGYSSCILHSVEVRKLFSSGKPELYIMYRKNLNVRRLNRPCKENRLTVCVCIVNVCIHLPNDILMNSKLLNFFSYIEIYRQTDRQRRTRAYIHVCKHTLPKMTTFFFSLSAYRFNITAVTLNTHRHARARARDVSEPNDTNTFICIKTKQKPFLSSDADNWFEI